MKKPKATKMKKEKITKFSDFIYYYKWHVIISVIVVALIIFLVRDCATKVEDDLVVSVLISNYTALDTAENMAADFTGAGIIPDVDGDGTSKMYVNIVTIPVEPKTEQEMMANYQSAIAMAADDSELFLVDKDLLEVYEAQGAFGDISDKAEKYGFTEDEVYIAEDGTLMGLSLAGNEYLESRGMVTDTLYACFRPLSGKEPKPEDVLQREAADDILDYILK